MADTETIEQDDQIEGTETVGPDETVVQEEEVEQPSLSEDTIQAAKSYGLSAEDLDGWDDARAQKLFSGITRRMAHPPQYQPGNGQAQRAQQEPAKEDSPVKPFELPDLSDFEEPIANTFKQLGGYVNDTVGGLMKQLQSANQQVADMQTMMELSAFDAFIESLGDEWNGEFGKGSTLDMDPNSVEYAKRVDVFRQGKNLQPTHYQMFGQYVPLKEMWKRAWSGQYADKIASNARKGVSNDLKRRKSLVTERPQRGSSPPVDSRQAALMALKGQKVKT